MVLLEGREVEVAAGMDAALILLLVVVLFEFGDLFFGGDAAASLVGGAEATEVSVETAAEREEGGKTNSLFVKKYAHQEVYRSHNIHRNTHHRVGAAD